MLRLSLLLTLSIAAPLAIPSAEAATVIAGVDPVTDNGGADGWSGVTVLETAIGDAGDGVTTGRVTTFNFHTDNNRETQLTAGEHRVTPLLIEFDGFDYRIVGIGAERTPTSVGAFSFEFDLQQGTDEVDTSGASTYHIGLLQQRDGVDDTDAGAVPFAGTGGSGMFQMNIAGPDFVPTVDTPVTAGHASGVDGRLYSFNFEIEFDEPTDTDEDGMPDEWEDLHALNKNDPDDADDDPDNDMSDNLEEFTRGTDPRDEDTDGDTLKDGVESGTGIFVDATDTGTNPKSDDSDGDSLKDNHETNTGTYVDATNTGTNPNDPDSDDDGLGDEVENNSMVFVDATNPGTSPVNDDSDGDGCDDGFEVEFGYDPTDPSSVPDGNIAGQQELVEGTDTDGWTHLLYVDESRTFKLDGAATANEFNFIASNDTGTITPLILEVTAPDTFIVRAIGTTRVGGVDWTGTGPLSFAFSDDEPPAVQDGWAAGFMTYDGAGIGTGSPIPYIISNIGGWLTGSNDGSAPGLVVIDEAPGIGGSGTNNEAYGNRDYSFQIVAGPAGPGLQITSIVLDDPQNPDNGQITITWRSRAGERYALRYSTNLNLFEADINDSILSEGEETSESFSNPIGGAKQLFFRVEPAE